MSPTLVSDLYHKIVENLNDSDNLHTLLNLASTCHSMRTICLKKVFRATSILPRICDDDGIRGYSSDDDIYWKYLDISLIKIQLLLERNPSIATYVRELNIQSHKSNFGDEGFLQILAKFRNVTTFSLSTFYVPSEEIIWGTSPSIKPLRCFAQYWKGLPKSMQNAFHQIIHSNTIRTIDIQYFQDLPISLFLPCREITLLRLLYSSVAPVKSSLVNEHSIQIGSLIFGLSPKSIAPLLYAKLCNGSPVLDTSTLLSLSVRFNSEREEMNEFLFNLRGLRHLFVDSEEYSYSNVSLLLSRIDPDFLKNLESFKLHLMWRSFMWENKMTSPSDIYSTLSGFRVLLYLELSIVVQTVGPHSEYLMNDMDKLDEVLSTSAQYSTLRHISISISFDSINLSGTRKNNAVDRRRWEGLRSTHFLRLSVKPLIKLEVLVKI